MKHTGKNRKQFKQSGASLEAKEPQFQCVSENLCQTKALDTR